MKPVDGGRWRRIQPLLVASALVIVAAVACGEGQRQAANKGFAAQSASAMSIVSLPWTVVRSIPKAAFNPNYSTAFSLGHNCYVDSSRYGSAFCFDLDSGVPTLDLELQGSYNPRTRSIEIVRGAGGALPDNVTVALGGVLLGEGDWSLAWANIDVRHYKRVLVSNSAKPLRIMPLRGDMPGYGLDNLPASDGGFISIRTPYNEVRDRSTYLLSVYRIKDGRVISLPANPKLNPYWKWSGVVIPQPPGIQTEFRIDGSMPEGAPQRFDRSGHALAQGYAKLGPAWGNSAIGSAWFEWNLHDKRWQQLSPPGVKDAMVSDAFYAGTCLFIEAGSSISDGASAWWCRRSGGEWLALGDIEILGRNGGSHLIVRTAYSQPAQIVNVD
ncbi:MAG: hypothetical protein ACHQ50_10125 [Fimbriimonadales bacterium]